MPPAKGKRKAGRGAAVANEKSQGVREIDAEVFQAMLQDLDAQVEARCQEMQAETEKLKDVIRAHLAAEKLKLSKAIRQMPLKQFFEEYGEDPEAILYTAIQPKQVEPENTDNEEDGDQPRTVLKPKANLRRLSMAPPQQPLVAQTPSQVNKGKPMDTSLPMETPVRRGFNAGGGGGGMAFGVAPTPGTAARLALRGETLLSVNGSPVLIGPTQGAGGGSSDVIGGTLTATQAVEMMETGVGMLAVGDVSELSEDLRKTAFGKLQTLTEQINQLMGRLA